MIKPLQRIETDEVFKSWRLSLFKAIQNAVGNTAKQDIRTLEGEISNSEWDEIRKTLKQAAFIKRTNGNKQYDDYTLVLQSNDKRTNYELFFRLYRKYPLSFKLSTAIIEHRDGYHTLKKKITLRMHKV